jgi:soluble lytic murein transglycosylase
MALARFDRKDQAARVYASLGAGATALRLRWESERSSTARARIATELLSLARSGPSVAQSRQAIEILTGYSVPMARSESLMVARRAGELARASQANALFSALVRGGALTPEDMMAWGNAESDLGRWDAAARSYARVDRGPLVGRAAYYRARALLRSGSVGTAIDLLEQIPSRFPNDTFAAGTALYLLGDLALDDNRPDSTRALFNRLYTRYPTSEYAQRAALIAPLIAFARGDHPAAQRELEVSLRDNRLTGFDADAGRYWLGRAYLALGQPDMAAARFRELLARGPENYYALLGAARLDTMPWSRPTGHLTIPATLPAPLARAQLLASLGLDAEAEFERDGYTSEATTAAAQRLAGAAFLAAGDPSRATRMGVRALGAGAPRDGALLALLYPLPYRESLEASAARVELDPWLAAAVIRQESAFNPRATSGAGARGLMQVMPANGPTLARTVGISDFDPALLWQPEVNLAMGTRHLAGELSRYPELQRVLAAYNAGGGRVTRWSRTLLSGESAEQPGFDAELFVERIPYLETRVYIRNITVNRSMYQLLYERR